MRLGVLDVGSNTVHLLVVDAHRGAEPTPQLSHKSELRLAEHIDRDGDLSKAGADALVEAAISAKQEAEQLGCDELMGFATSAVRDAGNSARVLKRVAKEAEVPLSVLSGEDESRLTFLAVRRWLGWSAGNLICLDIGGGSLELAAGADEDPRLAHSLPLGAGRLTRDWFTDDPPSKSQVAALREYVTGMLAVPVKELLEPGPPDRVVATSKTFRTLARLAGAAPSSAGPRTRRVLSRTGLTQVTSFISRMASADLAELDGVSVGRAHQTLAGAVVAAAAMDALEVTELELCPWALREGVILRRLDWLDAG
ncbi:MAG TPA: Ppx/GppA phosphatase family protein [Jatrophihabitans sp.]|jgi:exopolyphosphatase/guanosine-5'-triphosphate,3'-diphosphate pyrophosphatase|uniref:Ppx/GppA phosphatase family protein n=1 Tax=Jatrophihabitans sp. TaxID=1932789 RepID=UPI002E072EE7|nr:Ppx/GppA phosphatase family protein [Jatrophihabitans sp.]